MINALVDVIASYGDRGAVVSFSRVSDIKADVLELKRGEYHTAWLDRMANYMTGDMEKFIPSDIDFKPLSLICVVMPIPKAILQFNYCGKPVDCVVPPHYTHWEARNRQALQYLQSYLAPRGFSVATAVTFPQKLLAVHCGLALYGRNNICYSNEFGSHISIMTYISDLPCEDATWFPIGRMEICENCRACVSSCPTGAIDANRRLINSDRCITLFNESAGEFPDWIAKDAHNSITGCTKCQDSCPANAHNKGDVTMGVTFTQEETTELMKYTGGAPYSDSLAAKLKATGIAQEFIDGFPRNLAALLQK